jgi:hypothetical protein
LKTNIKVLLTVLLCWHSRRKGFVEHEAHVREKVITFGVLVLNFEEREGLKELSVDGKRVLK